MKIIDFRATPVACHDQPLRNAHGVHPNRFVRTIVEVFTDEGLVGLGETSGDASAELVANRAKIVGTDPRRVHSLRLNVQARPRAYAALETACLDVSAKKAELPLCDYLGGRVRDRVPFSAYLFFKFADEEGRGDVAPGEYLTPDELVEQAGEFVDRFGFKSLKIKGGIFEPDVEVETFAHMREQFALPFQIRIDPNGNWSLATALRVAKAIERYEPEYLEDPCGPMDQMNELRKHTRIPLSTNGCVSAFKHVPPAVRMDPGPVDVILGDHHHWGGLLAYQETGVLCRVFGLGLSMHSNNHLGISMAAMLHVGAATPELAYAADTHYPWTDPDGDVLRGGKLQFRDGFLEVPDKPGLGVALDPDQLARLHEDFLRGQIDDRKAMLRAAEPTYPWPFPRF